MTSTRTQFIFTDESPPDMTISYTAGVILIDWQDSKKEIELTIGLTEKAVFNLLMELKEAIQDLKSEDLLPE